MIFGREANGVIIGVLFLFVLMCQTALRWLLGRLKTPIWLRRGLMLAPALMLTAWIVQSALRQQQDEVREAFGSRLPSGMHDLRVHVTGLREYVLTAYFRADPKELRNILQKPPFEPATKSIEKDDTWDEEVLQGIHLPSGDRRLVYVRNDLGSDGKLCTVYTDSDYDFVYLSYIEFAR